MKSVMMIAAIALTLSAAPAFAGGRHNGLHLGAGAGLLVSTQHLLTGRTVVGANLGANVNLKGGLLGLLLGGSSRGHQGGGGHGCGCY
jgi:hypothetical protein